MTRSRRAVTLLELLVVLAILGLLATIAYSVYSGHVLRAKIAATALQISELETACTQYQLDTGQYPPSSSGTRLAPGPIDPINNPGEGAIGCGYMITALVASLSGDMNNPIDARWKGPYIELNQTRVGTITGQPLDPTQPTVMPQVQLLDPFGTPYYYVRSSDYAAFGGTFLPSNNPFASEIWYNPSTIQIVSWGPNQMSNPRPLMGTDGDDITNFRY
jgi:prepilin-type N-terminal cleavage/methylation domain-containing protein